MRWLVVSPYLPHPAVGHGGGTAVLQLCRALARSHEVELLCFRRDDEAGLEAALERDGVRVVTVEFLSDRSRGWRRVRTALDRLRVAAESAGRRRPSMVVKYRRRAMREALVDRLREFAPEVVQVEYSFMADYARTARFAFDSGGPLWRNGASARPVVLLNTHELASVPRRRRLERERHPLRRLALAREVSDWRAHERDYVGWADEVLCVTEGDRRALVDATGTESPRTVPLGMDLEGIASVGPGEADPPRLLFVGSFRHGPNLDAARSLLTRIAPRVWQDRPRTIVEFVGAPAPTWLEEAARVDARVSVPGFLPELGPAFARSALFVAPLWSGGGIKIKVLEAMARGAAVLTTPIGAEGIDEAGQSLALARDEEEFARLALELLDAPPRRRELGHRARRWVEERYDWAAIVDRLVRIVQESPRA